MMTLQPAAEASADAAAAGRGAAGAIQARPLRKRWVAFALLPLLLCALLLLTMLLDIQNQRIEDRLADELENVSNEIQRLLDHEIAYLSGIAISKALDEADPDSFRAATERAGADHRPFVFTVILNDEYQQLLNLRFGRTQKPPPLWEAESLARVWATGQPVVGNLANGMFALRVPVLREGKVRYVLSEIVDPQMLSALLRDKVAAKGWIAALIDGRMTILARSENAEKFVGLTPTPDIVEKIRSGREGLERSMTKDGIPVYASLVPLSGSEWHLAMAIPDSALAVSHRVTRWLLIGGGSATLAMAAVLGLLILWRQFRRLESRTDSLSSDLAEAHRANDEKSAFLAMMSHELRTPLAGILGFSDLLTGSALDEQQRAWVVHQRLAGRTLMTLVNDILDYSKIEAGGITLERIDFDVEAVLEQSLALARPLAEAKGLRLTMDAGPVLSRWLSGDPTRVQQVIANFLGNAVKFTASGGIRLSMGQAEGADGRVVLRIAVTDTGIGIPEDRQHRLFKRYSQASTATTREYGGTGLGLSICKSLVELMEGSIGVESAAGVGSTFWFSIPLPSAPAPAPAMDAAAADVAAGWAGAWILLAEDSMVNQILTRTILEKAGYRVAVAKDGGEAVDLARGRPFALVLMDIHLPVLDGIAAARAIRALEGARGRMPILALTASSIREELDDCLSAGMNGHLAKPFSARGLLSAVGTALDAAGPAAGDPEGGAGASSCRTAMAEIIGAEKMAMLEEAFVTWAGGLTTELAALRADHALLAENAHRLIGSAGMLGHLGIVEAARSLCQECRTGDQGRVEAELARLLHELSAVRGAAAAPETGEGGRGTARTS